MSRRTGAAERAIELVNDHGATAADAVRLSDPATARVAGPDYASVAESLTADSAMHSKLAPSASGPQQGLAGPMIADDVPDDTSSTVSINVLEGQTIASQLNTPGDQDFFVFTGGAGEAYQFTLTPDDASGTGPDLLFQIVDADGNVIVEQDGGGFGADEQYTFTPDADGTYYINVKGFTGAEVGGYALDGRLYAGDPDPNSGTPLDAIDWGTRVDTDGVTNAEGDEVIHVYFAKTGEVTPHPLTESNVNSGWQQYEKDAAFVSFGLYENVVNVDFVEVDSQEDADFIFGTSPSAPVLLGAMSPPGEPNEGAAWFNNVGVGWDEKGLAQGGFGFISFTHELGHGMGMAHPHDNGGNSTVMNGVDDDQDSGDYDLNQGVFTVMTYNDGWPEGPDGESPSNNYGYEGTLMALDLAVLQQKYGANMDFATGDDVYTLPTSNEEGSAGGEAATMYACIWDAGGKDTIAAGEARNVTIDLREATLKYEVGGGGWVSHGYDAEGNAIFGGFTVANGVKIENAEGGVGDDILIGNDYKNRLSGDAGDDFLSGGGMRDLLVGGAGTDLLTGGEGADRFMFREALEFDRITDLEDGETVRLSRIDADVTQAGNQDFTMVDRFTDVAGQAVIKYNATQDVTRLSMDVNGDGRADMVLLMDGDHTAFDGFLGFVS